MGILKEKGGVCKRRMRYFLRGKHGECGSAISREVWRRNFEDTCRTQRPISDDCGFALRLRNEADGMLAAAGGRSRF